MSDYPDDTDDSQDWPLRDYSSRLRPPSRVEPEPEEDEAVALEAAPEPAAEPEPAPELEPEAAVEELDEQPEAAEPQPVEPEASVAVEEQHAEGGLRVPDGYQVLEGFPTGERRTVAIVVGRFNGEITNRLLEAALAELEEAGVAKEAILVMPVPGAFELPIAAMALAKTRRYACVVALGCVIRGETPHFDFVAGEAASGLQLAGIETGVPVSFGVLTCDTVEQAMDRAGAKAGNKGFETALVALEMANLLRELKTERAPRSTRV